MHRQRKHTHYPQGNQCKNSNSLQLVLDTTPACEKINYYTKHELYMLQLPVQLQHCLYLFVYLYVLVKYMIHQ